MGALASVFQGILNLGAAVFIPLVLLIIGLAVRLKPTKAFSAALTLGVALTGINLVISYMERTREMEAVKGRASYQENKGVGDLDPGAVTMDYQLACLSNFLMEKLDF